MKKEVREKLIKALEPLKKGVVLPNVINRISLPKSPGVRYEKKKKRY